MFTVIKKNGDGRGFYTNIPSSTPNNKTIAFLHRAVVNPREGFFRIDRFKDKPKYSFIGGSYVTPEKIEIDALSPKQIYQLAAYGRIDYLCTIYGHDCIMVEDISVLDRSKFIAILVDGNFEFIPVYKYLDSLIKFKQDLFFMNREFIHKGFMNPHQAISSKYVDFDSLGLEQDSEILKNKQHVIWRRVIKEDNDSHLALYRADKINEFNEKLYIELINFNREVADELRQQVSGTELINLRKSLYFYGLL